MSTAVMPGTGKKSPLDRPAFKVRDLGLAEFGRNEIRLAEFEMPEVDTTAVMWQFFKSHHR